MNVVDVVPAVAQQRIVAGAAATLEVIFTDQNGEPAAATGTVTVKVDRAEGTNILPTSTATQTDSETLGRYTVALAGTETAQLDLLTATWSVTGTPAKTTLIEIVGGVYFTLTEAREQVKSLTDDRYSDADLLVARRDVETEFEEICGAAFVPRYRRVRVDSAGGCTLQMPDVFLRRLRELGAFDDDALAAVSTSIDGELRQDDAFPWFAQGIAAYEHGLDRPPPRVKLASLQRLREVLSLDDTGVDARTTSYTVDGETYTLALPGKRTTGNPQIDAVLARYDYREMFDR